METNGGIAQGGQSQVDRCFQVSPLSALRFHADMQLLCRQLGTAPFRSQRQACCQPNPASPIRYQVDRTPLEIHEAPPHRTRGLLESDSSHLRARWTSR